MERQADIQECMMTREALAGLSIVFERAYASWRERLLDQSWDGVLWAEGNGEFLLQEFVDLASAPEPFEVQG